MEATGIPSLIPSALVVFWGVCCSGWRCAAARFSHPGAAAQAQVEIKIKSEIPSEVVVSMDIPKNLPQKVVVSMDTVF